MDGITRVYVRGKTRLQTSSWISTTSDYQCDSVVQGLEGSGGGSVVDDAQLQVLHDDVGDGQCSDLLMVDGLVVASSCVDDDACDLNQCQVVRGNGCKFVQFLA